MRCPGTGDTSSHELLDLETQQGVLEKSRAERRHEFRSFLGVVIVIAGGLGVVRALWSFDLIFGAIAAAMAIFFWREISRLDRRVREQTRKELLGMQMTPMMREDRRRTWSKPGRPW